MPLARIGATRGATCVVHRGAQARELGSDLRQRRKRSVQVSCLADVTRQLPERTADTRWPCAWDLPLLGHLRSRGELPPRPASDTTHSHPYNTHSHNATQRPFAAHAHAQTMTGRYGAQSNAQCPSPTRLTPRP
jgi:hypothetical protein